MSIATELASNLSDNTDLALLELRTRIANLRSSTNYDEIKDSRIALAVIEAWYKKFTASTGWSYPSFAGGLSPNDKLRTIISSINNYELTVTSESAAAEASRIFDIEEQIKKRETFGIALISTEDKDKIRSHIHNIRVLIGESELSERKRTALLQRLSNLEQELETVGAKTDRFFVFMGDAAFAMGDFANKASPFVHEVKEIMKIIFQGREDAEGIRLPKRGDDMLLPPPEE